MPDSFTAGPWCIPAGEGNELVICEGDNPSTPGHILFVLRHPSGTKRLLPYAELAANAFLIAAAPEMLEALKNAAATIGAIYEWVERVEKNGGAKTISGVASCHAMLTSLRKNAERTEKLVMEPVRAALAKAESRS